VEEQLNPYKEAPTWLFNLEGESKLFETQEQVDDAWDDGWFGPPWLVDSAPLISGIMEGMTKREIQVRVADDPRYDGLEINTKHSLAEINEVLVEFEEAHNVGDLARS
jgi:hypothetical protein